jgi:hypothetical protein
MGTNDILIIVDDDVLYPKQFIEILLRVHMKHSPNTIVTGYGYPEYGAKKLDDVVFEAQLFAGFAGVLCRRWHFDDYKTMLQTSRTSEQCIRSDDFVMSNHVVGKKIRILALAPAYLLAHLQILDSSSNTSALHLQDNNHVKYKKCSEQLRIRGKLNMPRLPAKISTSWQQVLQRVSVGMQQTLLKMFGPLVKRSLPNSEYPKLKDT